MKTVTKTSRPAQSPAKQKQAANSASRVAGIPAETATGAVTLKVAAEELPRTHEMIIDAVADLLTHGGHADDANSLICASISHIERRAYEKGIGIKDQKVISEAISHAIHEFHGEWKTDLAIGWRKNRRPETPPAFAAPTITGRIRANSRERMDDLLLKFAGSAAPEEQHLMIEILQVWDSVQSITPLRANGEIFLGEAFYATLGKDAAFIKVPSSMVDQVQKYVDALQAIENKEA
jgi:hypothetical protein